MATPQSQTGNSFPRRTTDQPALPNRPAEGSEKDLKQPDDRSGAPARARHADERQADERQAEDWGLDDARGGMSLSKKVALALGLLAAIGGGAYAYRYHFQKSGDSVATQSETESGAVPGTSGSEESPDSGNTVGGKTLPGPGDDPFADPPPRRTASMGDMNEPPELVPVPGQDEPELGFASSAAPRANTPNRSLRELELELESENAPARSAIPPQLDQPELDSPELLTLDARPAPRPQLPPARSDELELLETATPPRAATPPPASKKISASSAEDPFATMLDGDVAIEKGPTKAAPPFNRPTLPESVPEIVESGDLHDKRLEGFTVQEDLSRRRAISRTVITRAPADASSASSGARLTAGFETQIDDGLGRTSSINPGSAGAPIQSRSSPPATAVIDAARPGANAGALGGAGRPSELYTVAPNDNYWDISRKQYGTARYFMALSKHNAKRIPDPHRMKPGMKVETPPADVLEQLYPDLIEKAPRVAQRPIIDDGVPRFGEFRDEAPPVPGAAGAVAAAERPSGYFVDRNGVPMYQISQGDTLSDIAQRHLGRASRWLEVYELNRNIVKTPGDLTIGTVIRLPADASRLSLIPENAPRR
jgi:nucleoid-associated protein YgaU